jgi:hypothetical protein
MGVVWSSSSWWGKMMPLIKLKERMLLVHHRRQQANWHPALKVMLQKQRLPKNCKGRHGWIKTRYQQENQLKAYKQISQLEGDINFKDTSKSVKRTISQQKPNGIKSTFWNIESCINCSTNDRPCKTSKNLMQQSFSKRWKGTVKSMQKSINISYMRTDSWEL